MSTRFLTIQEAQNELGVGRSTIYNLFAAGKLQSVKVGRNRRITRDSFNEFLEELFQQIEPPSQG